MEFGPANGGDLPLSQPPDFDLQPLVAALPPDALELQNHHSVPENIQDSIENHRANNQVENEALDRPEGMNITSLRSDSILIGDVENFMENIIWSGIPSLSVARTAIVSAVQTAGLTSAQVQVKHLLQEMHSQPIYKLLQISPVLVELSAQGMAYECQQHLTSNMKQILISSILASEGSLREASQ